MNISPLDGDSQSRFRATAGILDMSKLEILDQLAAKTLLGAMLSDSNALANAPAIIDATPGISAPVKRFFDVAFEAARKPPVMANGATLPSSKTVAIAAAIGGFLIGCGVAVMVLD